jgi:uncharacterized protein (DUF885 family)
MRVMRAMTPTLVLLATAAVAAVAAGDPAGALRQAEREYRQHLLLARPDLATRFGVRGAESRLQPVTEATLGADAAMLGAIDSRLAAIDRAALEPQQAARLDTLRARIARERSPHASGAWRSDASIYLALGPGAVLDVAGAPRSSPCSRAKHATERLRALPEVLRAARVNLAGGARGDARPWLAAMDSLRALPSRLAGCREPERVADLVEADSLALSAIDRFIRFLHEELGTATPGPGPGESPGLPVQAGAQRIR